MPFNLCGAGKKHLHSFGQLFHNGMLIIHFQKIICHTRRDSAILNVPVVMRLLQVVDRVCDHAQWFIDSAAMGVGRDRCRDYHSVSTVLSKPPFPDSISMFSQRPRADQCRAAKVNHPLPSRAAARNIPFLLHYFRTSFTSANNRLRGPHASATVDYFR